MKNFEELGIRKDLIKGLSELNIITPSDVQQEVIPLLLNSTIDLVAQAKTGTGKTAAFGLPLLHRIDPGNKVIQGLVLCPTRELCQQVAKQLFKFTKYSDKIFTESVYGGAKIETQIAALRRPTHIVVATPGRLLDLVRRKALDIRNVKTLIMDEADEMLTLGFKKDLDEILELLAEVECKWLFSATMPQGIKQIVSTHLSPTAHRIEVGGRSGMNDNIYHQYLICEEPDKLDVLMQFLQSQKKNRGIIFCRTKAVTDKLGKQLKSKNMAVEAIHGDLLQKERDKIMRAFKNESLQIIVATDLAARGLDIADLAYVVHYQLPQKDEYYTHRSGRTARAGKEGISLSLINESELRSIKYLERSLEINFKEIRRIK